MSFTCDLCILFFKDTYHLNQHLMTTKHQFVALKIKDNMNALKINQIELQLEDQKAQFILQLEEKDEKIKRLEQELVTAHALVEQSNKILEKAAMRTTHTTINSNTNNILQYLSSEPIRFSTLSEDFSKMMGLDRINVTGEDFAENVRKSLLQDNEGNNKLVCTDIARGNFAYKDEQSGMVIYDPMLDSLREKLRKGCKRKIILNELREELDRKYGNSEDNADKKSREFARACVNLQFEEKFVKRVARRTYYKTKLQFID